MIESKGHKITPIDGDLAVSRNAEIGRDVDIQGKARVAGSLKVEGFLDAPNIKGAVKGLFATEEELKREYPNPRPGWCAIVLADDESGFLYLAKNREWEKQSKEAKPFEFIADSITVFASKGELADETARAQDAEEQLRRGIEQEATRAKEAENNIKSKALQTDTVHFLQDTRGVSLGGRSIDGKSVVDELIPVATTEMPGAMSPEDKVQILNNRQDIENTLIGIEELKAVLADGSFVVGVADLANAVKAGAVTFEMLDGKLRLSVSVVDDLETANTLKPLSANQGKVLKNLIDIINGTGEGSTDKKITDAIAALVDSAPENLDTLRELAEWIEDHGMEVERIFETIEDNATAIKNETHRATGVEDTLRTAINVNTTGLTETKKDIANQLLVDPTADKVTITGRNEQSMRLNFESDIPAATIKQAGVMTAEDKTKLDAELDIREIATPTELDFNEYVEQGIYNVHCFSDAINSPINSTGEIKGRLTVLSTSQGSTVITQVLNLNNNVGGEGNIYIRAQQNGTWKAWVKLQTNVEVGLIDQTKMDDLTDNGIYSGILSTTGETFVIICINNYAIAQQVGVQHISHLKYSLVVGTGEVKIEKRTRDAYGFWTKWENIGGGSTLPEATRDTIGGIKIGTELFKNNVKLGIDKDSFAGIGITEAFRKGTSETLDFNWGDNVDASHGYGIPLYLGSAFKISSALQYSPNRKPVVLLDTNYFYVNNHGLTINPNASFGDSATKVVWNSTSNMNDYKTAGTYEIYGERTRQDDNLPILNASTGHSIAARLTVVASTLQPANNEICVTQFLQLSNRVGGDGATYVRTYNENNNGMNGWSAWQKQMGMVETYINNDYNTIDSQGQPIGGGLRGMMDNGIYSGIYTDGYTDLTNSTFIETFALIVINDYAVSGQAGLPRHITQLKYAVDAITGQSTVKKRVGTGNDSISWSDWTDIGGGGSQEVDITDAVKAYGLPTLVQQGFSKKGVTYRVNIDGANNFYYEFENKLDKDNKIYNHIVERISGLTTPLVLEIKFLEYSTISIDCYFDGYYYKYMIQAPANALWVISVSSDTILL